MHYQSIFFIGDVPGDELSGHIILIFFLTLQKPDRKALCLDWKTENISLAQFRWLTFG